MLSKQQQRAAAQAAPQPLQAAVLRLPPLVLVRPLALKTAQLGTVAAPRAFLLLVEWLQACCCNC